MFCGRPEVFERHLRRFRAIVLSAWPAALLALALLTCASVRSTAMQALGSGVAPCRDMGAMAEAGGSAARGPSGKVDPGTRPAKGAVCPFCADAAHAPVLSFQPPLQASQAAGRPALLLPIKAFARSFGRIRPRVRDPPPVLLEA